MVLFASRHFLELGKKSSTTQEVSMIKFSRSIGLIPFFDVFHQKSIRGFPPFTLPRKNFDTAFNGDVLMTRFIKAVDKKSFFPTGKSPASGSFKYTSAQRILSISVVGCFSQLLRVLDRMKSIFYCFRLVVFLCRR